MDYDAEHDVLYCHIGDTSNLYGDEVDGRVILLRDIGTETLTGITVMGFLEAHPGLI